MNECVWICRVLLEPRRVFRCVWPLYHFIHILPIIIIIIIIESSFIAESKQCTRGSNYSSTSQFMSIMSTICSSTVRKIRFYNRTDSIDRNQLYPNLLKRLGGEFSQCAEAVYREIKSFCSVRSNKHIKSLCYPFPLSALSN